LQAVKYRTGNPKLRPRRTRLEVPGWAGEQVPRVDGSHEYPWHCIPFSEYTRGGIELCYPYAHELRISMREGEMWFEGEFENPDVPEDEVPPFRGFGDDYYTYQILLDLKVEEGWAIKTETHPRFYTDRTGTVPIAVPAVLRHWWPMMFFCVFKAPLEGQTHIFRPGEPFLHVSVVQADQKLELTEMTADEAAERELQSRRIYASRATLSADTHWVSSTNTAFDGTYRRLAGAARSVKTK